MPVTADSQIRSQLDRIREQLADLRQRRADAKRERDAAKEALGPVLAAAGGKIDFASTEFKAAEQTVKKVGDLDDEIEEHRQSEAALLRLIGQQDDNASNGHHTAALGGAPAGRGVWNGHRLLAESEAYAEARERGVFSSRGHFGTIELGQLADRDQTVGFLRARQMAQVDVPAGIPGAPPGSVGTPGGAVPPDYRGILPINLGSLSLLDLIPTGPTDSNSIDYVQVIGVPDGAAEVDELQLKPESGLLTRDETAPVRTIATWLKVARNALDDVSGLGTIINTLLPAAVRRRVIGQILMGSGENNSIRGIYNTTGIGEPAHQAGDNIADAFLRAITVVVMSDAEANFAALNPLTWQDLLLMKNAQGNYIYGSPGTLPGGNVAQTIWGLAITSNRLVPQDKPLVGDAQACTLLVREGVNVKTSDSDQDDFVRNRVTILAETRIAFLVWFPSAFAVVALNGGNGNGNGGNGGDD